jgi:5-methylcytosine-specific restriction endonuclease McrA
MSQEKRKIRHDFMTSVFERDGHRCAVCKYAPEAPYKSYPFDAHHITDRHDMPAGGYVPENGITLCWECHLKAETFRKNPLPGYSPEELYAAIGSSKELAVRKSNECLEVNGSNKV